MGQYYRPIILDDNGKPMKYFDSHYYNNGLKLMEHSYQDNEFVAAVESLLAMDAALPVVWSGDYADEDLWALCSPEMEVRFHGVTPPRYLTDVGEPNAAMPITVTTKSHRYVVNVDKAEFVDKLEVPVIPNWGDGRIHPLPLLTADGNGRGGGDYRGYWPYVGRWARNRVAVTVKPPTGYSQLNVSGLAE